MRRGLKYGVAVAALSVCAVFTAPSHSAFAATVSWDGGGGDTNFSTAANWSGDTLPQNGDSLVFDGSAISVDTDIMNDLSSLSLAGISFTGAAGTHVYTLNGNALMVGGTIGATTAATVLTPLTLSSDVTISGSIINFGQTDEPRTILSLNGHNLISAADYNVMNMQIAGTGDVTINPGTGARFTASNTFNGSFQLNGWLQATHPHAFGADSTVVLISGAGANVDLTDMNNATVTNSFILSGADNGVPISTSNTVVGSYPVYSPDANVIFSGVITLTVDSLVSPLGTMMFTGDIAGAHTLGVVDGSQGKLIINSSNNQSSTPNGTYEPKALTTHISAKETNTVYANPNSVYVIDANGEATNVQIVGGTLKGTGTVGTLQLDAGTLAPGMSPGILNSGNFLATGGSYAVEIGGTAAGQYDQLNVTGTVDLGSSTQLSISHWNGFIPSLNSQFVIINNDGSDAITGTFQGLANGATVTVDGVTYTINYAGGDGNDVVLTVTGLTSSAAAAAAASAAKAPDTGVFKINTYPALGILVTVLCSVGLGLIARKQLARR